jgi:hypothetical protein
MSPIQQTKPASNAIILRHYRNKPGLESWIIDYSGVGKGLLPGKGCVWCLEYRYLQKYLTGILMDYFYSTK